MEKQNNKPHQAQETAEQQLKQRLRQMCQQHLDNHRSPCRPGWLPEAVLARFPSKQAAKVPNQQEETLMWAQSLRVSAHRQLDPGERAGVPELPSRVCSCGPGNSLLASAL